MKKEIAKFFALVFTSALLSCSSNRSVPQNQNEEDDKFEFVVLNTAEDIRTFLLDGLPPYMTIVTDAYKYTPTVKSTVPVHTLTLYGYNSMISEGDKKGFFGKEAAKVLGITSGVYIVARERYYKTFKFSQGQYVLSGYPVNHSRCGYMPTATAEDLTRGYSVEQKGEDITLTTLVIHVKYEAGTGYPTEVYSPLGYKGIKNILWNVPYVQV